MLPNGVHLSELNLVFGVSANSKLYVLYYISYILKYLEQMTSKQGSCARDTVTVGKLSENCKYSNGHLRLRSELLILSNGPIQAALKSISFASPLHIPYRR